MCIRTGIVGATSMLRTRILTGTGIRMDAGSPAVSLGRRMELVVWFAVALGMCRLGLMSMGMVCFRAAVRGV